MANNNPPIWDIRIVGERVHIIATLTRADLPELERRLGLLRQMLTSPTVLPEPPEV